MKAKRSSVEVSEMDPWKDDRCRDFVALNTIQRLRAYHLPPGEPMPPVEPVNMVRATNLLLLPRATPDYRPCLGERPPQRHLHTPRKTTTASRSTPRRTKEESDHLASPPVRRRRTGDLNTEDDTTSSTSSQDEEETDEEASDGEETKPLDTFQGCALDRARAIFFGTNSFTSSTSPHHMLQSPHVSVTPSNASYATPTRVSGRLSGATGTLELSLGGGVGGTAEGPSVSHTSTATPLRGAEELQSSPLRVRSPSRFASAAGGENEGGETPRPPRGSIGSLDLSPEAIRAPSDAPPLGRAAAGSVHFSCEICDALIAYYQSLLTRGIVLDRFNHKDLAFAWWVVGRNMDRRALENSGPMRREALLIAVKDFYYSQLSSKRRPAVAGAVLPLPPSSTPEASEPLKPPIRGTTESNAKSPQKTKANTSTTAPPSTDPTSRGIRGSTRAAAVAAKEKLMGAEEAAPSSGGRWGGSKRRRAEDRPTRTAGVVAVDVASVSEPTESAPSRSTVREKQMPESGPLAAPTGPLKEVISADLTSTTVERTTRSTEWPSTAVPPSDGDAEGSEDAVSLSAAKGRRYVSVEEKRRLAEETWTLLRPQRTRVSRSVVLQEPEPPEPAEKTKRRGTVLDSPSAVKGMKRARDPSRSTPVEKKAAAASQTKTSPGLGASATGKRAVGGAKPPTVRSTPPNASPSAGPGIANASQPSPALADAVTALSTDLVTEKPKGSAGRKQNPPSRRASTATPTLAAVGSTEKNTAGGGSERESTAAQGAEGRAGGAGTTTSGAAQAPASVIPVVAPTPIRRVPVERSEWEKHVERRLQRRLHGNSSGVRSAGLCAPSLSSGGGVQHHSTGRGASPPVASGDDIVEGNPSPYQCYRFLLTSPIHWQSDVGEHYRAVVPPLRVNPVTEQHGGVDPAVMGSCYRHNQERWDLHVQHCLQQSAGGEDSAVRTQTVLMPALEADPVTPGTTRNERNDESSSHDTKDVLRVKEELIEENYMADPPSLPLSTVKEFSAPCLSSTETSCRSALSPTPSVTLQTPKPEPLEAESTVPSHLHWSDRYPNDFPQLPYAQRCLLVWEATRLLEHLRQPPQARESGTEIKKAAQKAGNTRGQQSAKAKGATEEQEEEEAQQANPLLVEEATARRVIPRIDYWNNYR